jgi:hypothetical protein
MSRNSNSSAGGGVGYVVLNSLDSGGLGGGGNG